MVHSFAVELATGELRENFSKILCRILLPAGKTSLRALEVFYDCSGGNSRPSRPSGVGGGNFLGGQTPSSLFLLVIMVLLDCRVEERRSTPNGEPPMLRSAKLYRLWWPLALALIALIFAIVVLIIFLRLESWPARTARQSTAELERLGKNLRAAFIDIAHLQPRITINDRVYIEQTTPVSELVVLSRRIEVEHELLHTWAGSSKRVKLHGTFIAKAGFDLRKGLSINIRPNEIIMQLPHAQILGVEQQQVDVLAFENGLWNRISGQDVQSELSVLPELAWKKAAQSELPAEAEETLRQQLEQRIHTAQPLHMVFKDEKKSE